uniref:Uncharacterized protein n=1 Tax=Arundo donax TaxID=35708 RepID=A0A0A9ASV4_ARUDO
MPPPLLRSTPPLIATNGQLHRYAGF